MLTTKHGSSFYYVSGRLNGSFVQYSLSKTISGQWELVRFMGHSGEVMMTQRILMTESLRKG